MGPKNTTAFDPLAVNKLVQVEGKEEQDWPGWKRGVCNDMQSCTTEYEYCSELQYLWETKDGKEEKRAVFRCCTQDKKCFWDGQLGMILSGG